MKSQKTSLEMCRDPASLGVPITCHYIGTPYLIRNITSNITKETTHKEILAANTCEILMNIKIPNNGH